MTEKMTSGEHRVGQQQDHLGFKNIYSCWTIMWRMWMKGLATAIFLTENIAFDPRHRCQLSSKRTHLAQPGKCYKEYEEHTILDKNVYRAVERANLSWTITSLDAFAGVCLTKTTPISAQEPNSFFWAHKKKIQILIAKEVWGWMWIVFNWLLWQLLSHFLQQWFMPLQ